MNSKKYDDIDKLFQTKLGNESSSETDWNTPSDHVFDQAMFKIDQEKKKKRKLIIFWLGFGLIICGLGVFSLIYYPSSEKAVHDRMESKPLQNFVEASKNNDEALLQRPEDFIDESSLIVKPAEVEKQMDLSMQKGESTIIKQASIHAVASRQLEKETLVSVANQKSPNVLALDSPIADSKRSIESHVDMIPSLVLSQILKMGPNSDDIEHSESINDVQELTLIDLDTIDDAKLKKSNQNAWSIGLGSNLSSMRMINISSTDATLTEYDNYYPGLKFDINYNRQLKPRIALQTHIGISQIRNKSTFVTEFDYDKSLEFMDTQGKLMYDSDYSSANPLGEITNRLEMFVGEEVMEDGDKMNQETRNNQQLWMVSTGIGLALNLIKGEHILWDISSGVAINHLASYQGSFETEISHKNKLMYEESLLSDATDQMKQNILSVQLKSKLVYKVSNSFDLYAEGATNNYIQSFKKVNPNSPEKTFVNVISLSFGVQHRF